MIAEVSRSFFKVRLSITVCVMLGISKALISTSAVDTLPVNAVRSVLLAFSKMAASAASISTSAVPTLTSNADTVVELDFKRIAASLPSMSISA